MKQREVNPALPPEPSLFTRITANLARVIMGLPTPVLRVFGTVTNSDGEKLGADVNASLKLLRIVSGKDITTLPAPEARKLLDEQAILGGGKRVEVGSVTASEIAGVPVRIYRPEGATAASGPIKPGPAMLFFHGGGWVLGSLDSHDNSCRYLCKHANIPVISVDYRLAPEHPYPAAADDVHAVVKAGLAGNIEGVDPKRIAIGGDSAGGNLAAITCLRLRADGDPQPALQMLFVPAVNLEKIYTESHREFYSGFFLTHEQMEWYSEQYCPDESLWTNPLASPIHAVDTEEGLTGVAPAYVAVAGFDPLRDEGLAYGQELQKAGVPVEIHRYGGLVHPFLNSMGIWREARTALDDAAGALRTL